MYYRFIYYIHLSVPKFISIKTFVQFSEQTAQESGNKKNWNRSWDKLENGNEWINLNQKRKYLRIYKINEMKYNKSVKMYEEELELYGNAVFVADSIDTTVEVAQVIMIH